AALVRCALSLPDALPISSWRVSASCFPDPAPGRDGGRRGWDVPQTRRAGAVGAIASAPVRCPTCSSLEDRVVDSRLADDGTAIRSEEHTSELQSRENLVC